MKSNIKEMNQMYDDACHFYLTREWKPCPRCKCSPVLGWHIQPPITRKKDELNLERQTFNAHLTLTCKCGTFDYATMNPNLLVTQWINHCHIIRATEKGIVEVKD